MRANPARRPFRDPDSALKAIGATITSGLRTPERNRAVGGAARSYHLSDRARDIRKTPGMSLDKIKRAIEASGRRVVEILDEGDHFHVAWS